MRFFLALIGFSFLIMTGFIAVIVWKVHKRMRTIREAMQDSMKGNDRQHQSRRTTSADGVTIIDDRTPEKMNKRIFEKNEGEYVDYVEN